MTPAARASAAIEVLDGVLTGAAAEQQLTAWARRSRFAGSGDRAAVRDLVYSALRRRRSAAWLGGAETGRGLILGLLRDLGQDVEGVFSGARFAPDPVTEDEAGAPLAQAPRGVRTDMSDWLIPELEVQLGAETDAVLAALRDRAAVHLRVNLRACSVEAAAARVTEELGCGVVRHPVVDSALVLEGAPRGIEASGAYQYGWVELQDAGSQALVAALPVTSGARVLDLCAGGGGKGLALAARADVTVLAHDANPGRMRDLPERAARAGVAITLCDDPEASGPFDGVICDVPCSGSGAWRRAPDAKWRLTSDALEALATVQGEIATRALRLVRPGGWVGYMTCSLLQRENADVIAQICDQHPGVTLENSWSCTPLDGCDGFYMAVLRRGN